MIFISKQSTRVITISDAFGAWVLFSQILASLATVLYMWCTHTTSYVLYYTAQCDVACLSVVAQEGAW